MAKTALESKLDEMFKSAKSDFERYAIEKLIYQSPVIPIKFTDIELVSIFERIDYYEQNRKMFHNHQEVSDVWNTYAKELEFSIFVGLVKEKYRIEAQERIGNLLSSSVMSWMNRTPILFEDIEVSKRKHINDSKSMVNGFLFQPPFIETTNSRQSEIRDFILKDWNPSLYVNEFYEKIVFVFKNI